MGASIAKYGEESTIAATASPAVYDCTFINDWSATSHPNQYPPDAHWSPPVLVAASEVDFLWAKGQVASPGMKVLAETGDPSLVQSEITEKTGYGEHLVGRATFNSQQQTQEFSGLRVDASNKYISFATMMAPSPDWFTGFTNIVPISHKGFWFNDFTVVSQPYDAGTDSGTTYAAENQATTPADPIGEFKGSVLGTINPVARMRCTRQKIQDEVPNSSPVGFGRKSKVAVATRPAVYDCKFENEWFEWTHPNDYPSKRYDNPGWSAPVLVAASEPDLMWVKGQVASPGMKVLAETGDPSLVESEITAKTGYGQHLVGDAMSFSRNQISYKFDGLRVDASNKYISLASMLVPSPDWFTGFFNVMPISQDGFWYERFTALTRPYDAGTDSGTTYTAANQATTPADLIRDITDFTSVLGSRHGRSKPRDVAKVTCRLRQTEAELGQCTDMEGWAAHDKPWLDCRFFDVSFVGGAGGTGGRRREGFGGGALAHDACTAFGVHTDNADGTGVSQWEACCLCRNRFL